MDTKKRNQMSNLSDKNKKNKIKYVLDFFTLQKCAFMLSIVFLVIAISSAYPVYMDDRIAQKSAQSILENFDNLVLDLEVSSFQTKTGTSESKNIMETLNTKEKEINVNDAKQLAYKSSEKSNDDYATIAKLQIDKIGLKSPVLSEWSYELLEISVNKFSGPEPNELGNFVIIGHNYSGEVHFGRLYLLEIGDLINLTDLSGRKITYEVYEILTINPDEIDKLTTYEKRTLTLVTCDASGELRIVIKSKDSSQ